MYRELVGIWGYAAGTNGTVQVPAGSTITQIVAWASNASASFTINNGSAVPVPANSQALTLRFMHDLVQAKGSSTGAAIVFNSNVSGYFVEYVEQSAYGT